MAYKTIHNCDRCGKELGYQNEFPVQRHKRVFWTATVGSRFYSFDGLNSMTKEFDLCLDCENKLIRFLNGEELRGDAS